jgi:transketolase
MSAAHHGLGNLICLVDINNQQADGPSRMLGFEPLADKWAAFGWHVRGRQRPGPVVQAFDAARRWPRTGPA